MASIANHLDALGKSVATRIDKMIMGELSTDNGYYMPQEPYFEPLTDMIHEWRGKCSNCDFELEAQDRYCGGCGRVLTDSDV